MEKNIQFSSATRSEFIGTMKNKKFDVLVIGGGITGAGIALDAASRGLSVALIEKQDFSAGTSSRSTKLVHGGLRYLEHLDLALVRKVGQERETVYKNAPHIVIPEKMLLPIIEDGSLGEFTTSLALFVYDFLAGVKKSEKRIMLSLEQTIEHEPLLNKEILKGGALYYEYKTDDSRLTIEILKKANEFGVCSINYAECTDLIYENEKVCGAQVFDSVNKDKFPVYADYVINAAGIWVDSLRKKDNSLFGKRLHITKGIHIVVDRKKLNLKSSMYFDVGDKRMVFAIPRFEKVYIGTTDTNYTENLENPSITAHDVEYLLNAINRIIPSACLTFNDVVSAWSGLRPLIHEDGKDPSELSRKDELFESASGLISIAGGKLTGYRLMAKKIVDLLAKKIKTSKNTDIGKGKTKAMKLSGGEFSFAIKTSSLIEFCDRKYDEAKQTGISVNNFKNLFFRYGTNIDIITEKAYEYYNQSKNSSKAWLQAEVWYCVNYEMTLTLSDFFIRRTGKIHFFIEGIADEIDIVTQTMQNLLNWTNEQKNLITENFKAELFHAQNYAD